jgi:protein-tyrosine-phosphatase
MAHVLFVCLHNAGRSQMSEALFAQAAVIAPSRRARLPLSACIRRS